MAIAVNGVFVVIMGIDVNMPSMKYRQVVALLNSKGFVKVRQNGSHVIFENSAGKRITIFDHGIRSEYSPPLVARILKQVEE